VFNADLLLLKPRWALRPYSTKYKCQIMFSCYDRQRRPTHAYRQLNRSSYLHSAVAWGLVLLRRWNVENDWITRQCSVGL